MDSEDWRRNAPNEDFDAPHVEGLGPDFVSALPSPNVYHTDHPEHIKLSLKSKSVLASIKEHQNKGPELENLRKMLAVPEGQESKFYYEMALWHVDDMAIGTFDNKKIVDELSRRFDRVTVHHNNGMFLGNDIEYEPISGLVVVRMRTYMERVIEGLLDKDPKDITLRSVVGCCNWATSPVFGTHLGEARVLASKSNLELLEDLQTGVALLHELYTKRTHEMHYRLQEIGECKTPVRTSDFQGRRD
jgi:hypothetical protein